MHFSTFTKIFGTLWILSIVIDTLAFFIFATYFADQLDKVVLKFLVIFTIIFVFGFLSFIIAIISFTISNSAREGNKESKVKLLLRAFAIILVFPLYLILRIVNPINLLKKLKSHDIFKDLNFKTLSLKVFYLVAIIFLLLPIWVMGYILGGGLIYIGGIYANRNIGMVEEPVDILGTGSMYPTIPKGKSKNPDKEVVATLKMFPFRKGFIIFGRKFFMSDLKRGDVISFENKKNKLGAVKRVIGLPGDYIEIRDGLVFINGERLEESYIARARSTFGGDFLSECKKIQIPGEKIFVMGDNRKGSGDSRWKDIGFVNLGEIDHTLSFIKQKGTLDKNWRDRKNTDQISKIKIDKVKYLNFLNEKRNEVGIKPLRYQSKLEQSAIKRGEFILKFDDFSYEATRSGYAMEKAMKDVGYSNIIWNEALIPGFYEADELIQYYFEFPDWKKFFLNKDFEEFGISEVEGEINGCPTQVVVQHFAGYIPPNYSKEEVEGWKKVLMDLKNIKPSWENVKNYGGFYDKNKSDVDRINEILDIRIRNIEAIVKKMDAREWLSEEENDYTFKDAELSKEEDSLAQKINEKISKGE